MSYIFNRKVSYDVDKKLNLNNFSSNLIRYLLDFFPMNDFIEIKKVCKNLRKIIQNMNLFREYLNCLRNINQYPKNIEETLFKENANYICKFCPALFLTEEEKMKLYQNYIYFLLRRRKCIILSENSRIGDAGFYFLSLYLKFVKCEISIINLNYSIISDESMRFFANSLTKNKTLKELHLNGSNLSQQSALQLAEGLKINNTIEKLEMSYNNNFQLEAIENFLNQEINILTLFFCDNQLKKDGGKILGEFLKNNTKIKNLYIEKNDLMDEGVSYISNGLRFNKSIEVLNLSDNKISSIGLNFLVESLNQQDCTRERILVNQSLQKLFLKSNIFNNPESAKLLGDLIEYNKSLLIIDLSNNGLSESLIRYIAEALRSNITLDTLILEGNSIGGFGTKILSENLKYNTRLKTLNLRNNALGFEGAKSIGELISSNSTLMNLNLQSNLLDDHSISLIVEKLNSVNQNYLQTINLANNQFNNIQDFLMNLNFAKDVLIY
jgi:Ran GTPase-activating protein (RanGAP) involved in mRNA processing and transport